MKRTETEIKAAFYVADFDGGPYFVRLDDERASHVYMSDLLGMKPDRPYVERLIEAPATPAELAEFPPSVIEFDTHERELAKASPPRVLRARIVVELEELPQDEAERWVAEALARDVARSAKDGE